MLQTVFVIIFVQQLYQYLESIISSGMESYFYLLVHLTKELLNDLVC